MSIELSSVNFAFNHSDNELVVLDSFSLKVDPSQIVAIVGPSGCGKSTILRLISGLLKASSGTILINGKSAEQCRCEGTFGFVFQSPALLPWRNVKNNVRLPLELRRQILDEQRVNNILKEVGLEGWGDRRPYELSGGMQQRVSLARALVTEPEVLLLDEPFSQLDELLRFELLFYVLDHAIDKGTTIVFVTHDISEAVLAADIVYVLFGNPVHSADRIKIDLPRPRSLESVNEPLFHEFVVRARSSLISHREEV